MIRYRSVKSRPKRQQSNGLDGIYHSVYSRAGYHHPLTVASLFQPR